MSTEIMTEDKNYGLYKHADVVMTFAGVNHVTALQAWCQQSALQLTGCSKKAFETADNLDKVFGNMPRQ